MYVSLVFIINNITNLFSKLYICDTLHLLLWICLFGLIKYYIIHHINEQENTNLKTKVLSIHISLTDVFILIYY